MRMIDRWFPCEAVSEASYESHGSGMAEKGLFTWFASRPVAQARAAVMTTLLPWPDDPYQQTFLKHLVTEAVNGDTETGRRRALRQVIEEIRKAHPGGIRALDPFSGRAIIPLEMGRVSAEAWGIDYSPVAALAGMLLADFPYRDWSSEPHLSFKRGNASERATTLTDDRLVRDLRVLLKEIGDRHDRAMEEFYPPSGDDERPWGYLWAQAMPCDECRNTFPMFGATLLRKPDASKGDEGQSFSVVADRSTGTFQVVLHEGVTEASPTLVSAPGKLGKVARCPFCGHPHSLDVIKTRGNAGKFRDYLLLVVSNESQFGPTFRLPSIADTAAVTHAEEALAKEPPFGTGIPAVPDERIPPGNNDTVRGSLYGVRTFGALACARQTLSFVKICRITADLQNELLNMGLSSDYVRALLGYVGSVIVRKLRRSTRGVTLDASRNGVHDIFMEQASLGYSYDFFEAGIGKGAGTWKSITTKSLQVVARLVQRAIGSPARIRQGSALHLPFRPDSIHAIITDPPYYEMIDYSDATDFFFVWLKRALGGVFPELFDTPGLQEKDEEIIVKRRGTPDDHRTRDFYTRSLQQAFDNMRTVLRDDGALTLVFGHSDPEAWRLLLSALMQARFVVTGSWPARTEAKSGANAANIVVTITIACRTAPAQRPVGVQAQVDEEVRREIRGRVPQWERDGLPLTDQLMAAYGPAMEVIGRYERVLRPDGTPVPIDHYLSLARRSVQDAAAIRIDGLPLEIFDARTRFALFWVRLYARQLAPKSEALFQAMASNLRLDDVRRDILEESTKGYRFGPFGDRDPRHPDGGITPASSLIDIVRQLVRAWRAEAGEGVAAVLALAERDPDDAALWAVITDLAAHLPAADQDRRALDDIIRNRAAIGQLRARLDRRTDKPTQLSLVPADSDR